MIMTNRQDRVLIFLHIQKAAGTTLNGILESHFQPENSYATSATARYPNGNLDDFFKFTPEKRAKIQLLNGHLGFGIHEQFRRPADYVTFLRDPIERVISHYSFERTLTTSPIYKHLQSGEMDIQGFVRYYAEAGEMDNLQTRMIAGNWHKRGFGPCTDEMLDTAKRNLREHFVVVGLAERFDESYIMLKRHFGWPVTFYTKRNVSRQRVRRTELSRDDIEFIREYNQFDQQLYIYGKKLFEERLQQLGARFKAEVVWYRIRNRLINLKLRHAEKRSIRGWSRRATA